MALSSFPPLLLLSILLLLLLSSTITNAVDPCADPPYSASGATELSIHHVNSHCSPFSPPSQQTPMFDSVQAQASKDPARLAYLASLVAGPRPTTVPVASAQQLMQNANYVLRAKFGTPGQLLFLALDTSADTAFVPCSGCTGCPSTSSAFFSPNSSSTYAPLDCTSSFCHHFKGQACPPDPLPAQACTYNQSFGGDTAFSAVLGHDSLRLALDIVPNYAFGCLSAVTGGASLPKQGLLGLGRGPVSLLAQSGALYGGVFSYCLPSFKSYYFSGSLRLGRLGQPKNIKTTPLLSNPHRPSLYYVNLTGVSVGRVHVPIPADSLRFDKITGAGTIVDSGTVITRFVAKAYAAVRDEFQRQVNASDGYSSLGAFDTCFSSDAVAPAVTLHLEGIDLVLPAENTLIHSSGRPVACLAMAAAPENVNAVVNVIANLQQQNLRVLFDVANSRVGFARELCN